MNPFTLDSKTVVVTGASSGIGRAIAIETSKFGAKVIMTGRDTERLNETAIMLDGKYHVIKAFDLTNEENMNAFISELPQIDGIVHAAGIVKTLPFNFINRDELDKIFQINFFAPTLLSQKLVKAKKLSKNSSIVFISSIDGPVTAHIGNAMYAASKGAINAISKNMAVDLASKKIRVNTILPGMTETPLIHSDGITQEQLDEDMKLYPLKRYGKPEEIAYAAIYFLSDASAWTTGSSLVIDGGFTLL